MPRGRRLLLLRGGRLTVVRWLLTCAITAIAAAALLAVHVIPAPSVPASLSAHFIHKLQQQREMGSFQAAAAAAAARARAGAEMRWTQETSPPQLSKLLMEKVEGAPSNSLAAGGLDYDKLWKPPSGKNYERCVHPTHDYSPPGKSRGYLLVHTNGGLNQMRAGISDMVAVARIINATLVIPELDKESFWQDSSNFSDVFDEKHFISYLSNDVKIVKKLPNELKKVHKAVRHFRSWSGVDYYKNEISYLWADHKVIRAAKSDSRLANNNLPPDIQKLRCRTFYEALRFSPHIEAFGKLLVERMRSYGPYIALHLRYEKDMLAFSGCTFGLSPTQTDELTRIRENTTHWKVKEIDPVEQRSRGYCPLTPKEVALFLSSLGYPSTTPIYIAAGEIYGGDFHMADLEARFPIIMNKAKLASVEELEPFSQYASQLAALDYIVSVESDVFIPSYSGNMARAVEGHRRFLGHRKTISPDRKALVRLYDKLEQGRIEGRKLSDAVVEIHRKRQGSPRKRKGPVSGTRGRERFRSEEAFYENPLPDCLCRKDSTGRGLML